MQVNRDKAYLSQLTIFLPVQSDTFGLCIIWCSLTDEKNWGKKELLTFFPVDFTEKEITWIVINITFCGCISCS